MAVPVETGVMIEVRNALKMDQMTRTTVMDADDGEAESKVKVHRHLIDMHTLADDIGKRVVATLEQNPMGCVYFNPVVTVSCPSPLPDFFRIVRNQQARWCRQASKTFSRKVRRRTSRWVSGGEWISNKHARYLDRSLCFIGALFIDGKLIPPHSWPKPAGTKPTESRLGVNTSQQDGRLPSRTTIDWNSRDGITGFDPDKFR